jgi:NADP-dependent 3-hydroxy acid dehydrogenase YdfG
MTKMSKPVCAVIGIGPGNGTAIARKFSSEGYKIALLSRNQDYLNGLAHELGDTRAYAYDALDPTAPEEVFGRIKQELGPIDVLVYNAASGVFGNVDQVKLSDFEHAWRINALGLLAAVKAVLPDMRARGKGNIVVTGATASVKHGANFTAFTSAKAAQRALAQSIAKHVGPNGVHVSLVIIDGVIDIPRTREVMPDRADDFFLKPDDIAQSVFSLTQQPRSAWTFELDVRPFGEKW